MLTLYHYHTFVAIIWLLTIFSINDASEKQHQQVHIALGTDETEMVITWATIHHIDDDGVVEFGTSPEDLTNSVTAITTHFRHSKTSFYNYRALLTGLKPSTLYYYRVGSPASSWSKVFEFITLNYGNKWLPSFAVYGDLGYENGVSLPYLNKDVKNGMYDVIFHIGDFAYNLNSNDGKQGIKFMNAIEKIAARIPYMTCPGNHESKANFSFYDTRFSMIGDRSNPKPNEPITKRLNNHFYSVDIGPAHIIMFSTEFYYYTKYGTEQIARQYNWLKDDLKRAHANRAQRPWIIVMGHRPLYCLKMGDNSCKHETMDRPAIRKGYDVGIVNEATGDDVLEYGLEKLFYKYGVDIQLYGHEHFYGRLLPIYNSKVRGGSRKNPYDDPEAPIHIVTGSAGNWEKHPKFNPNVDSLVDARFPDYGYTRLIFRDTHHLRLEQISVDEGGKVKDKINIIKNDDYPKWLRN